VPPTAAASCPSAAVSDSASGRRKTLTKGRRPFLSVARTERSVRLPAAVRTTLTASLLVTGT